MAEGARLAIAQVNESGNFLDGQTVDSVQGDTGCIDASLAVASAERLITSDGVKGIIGGMCSGVTGAVLQNAAIPNGVVMVSPSATSPGADHGRGQRAVLPHVALGCASGRRSWPTS